MTPQEAVKQNHKIYTYGPIRVFFKHTDYHGFVHPYNYLEWMSYTREAYFQDLVPNFLELTQRNIKMVTAEVELTLLQDAIFGDHIKVQIYSQNVKRLSFEVIFEFFRKREAALLAQGRQRLTFLDAETGRPARIPEELKEPVLLYEKKSQPASVGSPGGRAAEE